MEINPIKSSYKFNTIILAAGLGQRVRALNKNKPKPLTKIKGMIALDFFIKKFGLITDKYIVCTGYGTEAIESYLYKKYDTDKIVIVRQKVQELARGPGKSAILGLRQANPKNPTLIMFCDIIFEDDFSVAHNGLGLYKPIPNKKYVADTYKSLAMVSNDRIWGLQPNLYPERMKLNGWTGFAVIHDTQELINISDDLLEENDIRDIDYTFDLMLNYVRSRKTKPIYLSKLYEFGTYETLLRLKQDESG